MKSLIVYSSQTGNTEKLAQVVYETVPGDKTICPISEACAADGYDVIAIGFWLLAGKPDPLAIEYLSTLKLHGKPSVFLFAAHGAKPESDHVKSAFKHAASLLQDAILIGTFSCQGELSRKFSEKIKAKPVPPAWFVEAPNAKGHPDKTDIAALKQKIKELF